MIIKPGQALIFCNANEAGDGVYIGDAHRYEVGDDRYTVEVPLSDIAGLIKRLREVKRQLVKDVVEVEGEE